MRYGPCGQVVDISRRPYRTSCRFLRAYEGISEIKWVEALEDAPTLPYWSVISSLDLDLPDLDYDGPGEVANTPRRFTGQQAPEGLDGNHHCGTEQDFSEGGEYLPDAPPAPYDDLGYLDCCEVPPPPPPSTPVVLSPLCQTANLTVADQWYEATFLAGGDQWGWVFIFLPVPGDYRLFWEPITGVPFNCDAYQGLCFALTYRGTFDDPGECETFNTSGGGNWYFRWRAQIGTPVPWSIRFRVEPGSCP